MGRFNPEDNNSLSETKNLHIHLALSQDEQNQQDSSSSMSLPPETTPVPQPVFMPGMSHRTEGPEPTPSPIPVRPKDNGTSEQKKDEEKGGKEDINLPRLRLRIEDIGHTGASVFLSSVNTSTVLRTSIESIHKHLYSGLFSSSSTTTTSSSPLPTRSHPPPTRSVTLILRPMDGVAYTTGSDLDSDHKEIHFSLNYISSIKPSTPTRQTDEISGVLLHELVHCYQWNGKGAAPGGLIEGVADWVRLQENLAPPHWRRGEVPGSWDVGYQGTAYFLEYLESRFGLGTVRRLNTKLRTDKYEKEAFWTELLGTSVDELFLDYKKTLEKDNK